MASTPKTATFLVGIITALALELAAVRAVLDEEFTEPPEDFSLPTTDANTYTWGRIGNHNVVVTSLPAGVYGPTSASGVAERLKASLPHLRFGLMVGIGAGVATKDNNIRLGDVVVSEPVGTVGGVVQYDSVKVHKGHEERIGSLAKPPQILLTALTKWGSTYETDGSQISSILPKVFERKPRMKKTFNYPGAAKDPLRSADTSADNVDERENCPEIHRGVIASGHTLLKEAEERDSICQWLAKENIKPLCFEMEAAGLMEAFPCLVIRGICDYADEKKNDDWQRYAALTAACFMKEILAHVDAARVKEEEPLQKRLETIETSVKNIQIDTASIALRAHDHDFHNLLNWIAPENYSDRLHDILNDHQSGTAQWIFDTAEYQEWASSEGTEFWPAKVLFCYGDPGAGKTMTSALIVQKLLKLSKEGDQKAVAYVFFNYKQQEVQTVEHVLCTILRQLLFAAQSASESLTRTLRQHLQNNTRPDPDELVQAMADTLADRKDTFLVLDAPDECQRTVLKTVMERLRIVMQDCKLRLLVTARPIPHIKALFAADRRLRVRAASSDIKLYARERARQGFWDFLAIDEALVQSVVERVVEISSGIFLLARLIMDNLKEKLNVADMEESLETIPYGEDGLHHMHEKAMERIQSSKQPKLAFEALAWVVFGKRLLDYKALEHALAFDVDDIVFNPKRITPIDIVISQCAGLLTIEDNNEYKYRRPRPIIRQIRVIHEATQSYLEASLMQLLGYSPHFQLAGKCITYATIDNLAEESMSNKRIYGVEFKALYPLYLYAADYWAIHGKEVDRTCEEEALDSLLPMLKRISGATLALQQPIGPFRFHRLGECRETTIWHLMAMGDLDRSFQRQIKVADYSNSGDLFGRTPLHCAAAKNSMNVASLILRLRLTDPTTCDSENRTALYYAADNGYEDMVSLLLSTGNADLQMNSGWAGENPLQVAASENHDGVFRLLLEAASETLLVEIFSKEPSPLTAAAQFGHESVVRTILSKVKVDMDLNYAFRKASASGQDAVLRLLLGHTKTIDVNSVDSLGRSALRLAVFYGNGSTVEFLVDEAKADVRATDDDGSTPLHEYLYHTAAGPRTHDGHDPALKSLLAAAGARQVGKRNAFAETPLSIAALFDLSDSLERLLETMERASDEWQSVVDYPAAVEIVGRKILDSQARSGSETRSDSESLDNEYNPPMLILNRSRSVVSPWMANLMEVCNEDALALYLFMTDHAVCRSCGREGLHQGFHCRACTSISGAAIRNWKGFSWRVRLPMREFCSDLYRATIICSECVEHGCLGESVALYLSYSNRKHWEAGEEERPEILRSMIDAAECGLSTNHSLLWVDAQPLREHRFDDFLPPCETPPMAQGQHSAEAIEWKRQLDSREEIERTKMDVIPTSFQDWYRWKRRRCHYLRCDHESNMHSEWCVETIKNRGTQEDLELYEKVKDEDECTERSYLAFWEEGGDEFD